MLYPGAAPKTTVNSVLIKRKLCELKSSEFKLQIQTVVTTIGKELSTEMALYLANAKSFVIMLIRRWFSDSIMKYTCRQVKKFSLGLTLFMTENADFYTISNL